jgi:hypothetical protein
LVAGGHISWQIKPASAAYVVDFKEVFQQPDYPLRIRIELE